MAGLQQLKAEVLWWPMLTFLSALHTQDESNVIKAQIHLQPQAAPAYQDNRGLDTVATLPAATDVLVEAMDPAVKAGSSGTALHKVPTEAAADTSTHHQQQRQLKQVNRTGMPSATTAQMRVAQIGSPNDVPTQPEGNLPVITAAPTAGAPLYVSPNVSFTSVTEVQLDQPLLEIPQSFLGLSHEWTHVEEINNIPAYKDVINLLTSYGSGPMVMRVGGGSTDKQARVFPSYVYEALAQVHEETGMLFILGLNFEKGDIDLARQQFEIARKYLPPESIITFEIGNEVGGVGG